MSRLEAAGKPVFLVATDEFRVLANEAAGAQGIPTQRVVAVEHPIGGIDEFALEGRADWAGDVILEILSKG